MGDGLSVVDGIVLGAIQGLTEFLPVSSSGHLVLARDYLTIGSVPLLFDVLLHVATLFVIIFHYRELVWNLILALLRFVSRSSKADDREYLRLAGTVIGATVITVAVALLFKGLDIEATNRRSVSILMLVTAAILASTPLAGRYARQSTTLTWRHALITGIAQGFGTLAGISRSGITISASLWSGMERKQAGTYAFILSIPAVLGALVLTLAEESAIVSAGFVPTLVGCFAAMVVGLAALRVLLWMVHNAKLWYFSFYLVVAGLFGLLTTR